MGSCMSQYNFDEVDIGLLVAGLFSTAVLVGLATFTAFDVGLSDTFSFGGYEAPLAWILSVGTFAGTLLTNDNAKLSSVGELRNQLEDELPKNYFIAVVGTGAILIAWPFFPEVSDFITSADLWAILYLFAVTAGQMAVGWML